MARPRELEALDRKIGELDELELSWETWKGEHLSPKQQEEMENFLRSIEEKKEEVKAAIKAAVERYPDDTRLRKITANTFWADASVRTAVDVRRLEEIIGRPVTEVPGLAEVRDPVVRVGKLEALIDAQAIPEEAKEAIVRSGVAVKIREGARE